MSDFNLIMISAMYENGGNTVHRLLDGHPELFVYPYESQLGTSLVSDYLTSYVPFKYRWPEFPLSGSAAQDYELFFDEEMKVMLRTPERSKFRHMALNLNEADRRREFAACLEGKPRTRATLVEAFFRSTFECWTNLNRSGRETTYLGYSPVMCLDTDKILADLPHAHVIHVVRNPYSAFADTSKRPFPLGLERYTWTWNYCQMLALTYAEKYPRNFHIVRFEDVVADRKAALGKLCTQLGLAWSDTCLHPSWNGTKLEEVYPWGTIRIPTPEANLETANLLTPAQKSRIKQLSILMQRQLGYDQLELPGLAGNAASKGPSRRPAASPVAAH
jgi:hypothetical protein